MMIILVKFMNFIADILKSTTCFVIELLHQLLHHSFNRIWDVWGIVLYIVKWGSGILAKMAEPHISKISLSEMSSQFVINKNMPSEQASSFTLVLLITQLTWKRVCSIAIYRVLGPVRPLFSCLWVVSIVSTSSGSIQQFKPASSTFFSASFDTASFVFSRVWNLKVKDIRNHLKL